MSPNTLSSEEVIEEIRRIQEQHGKNLEVRVKPNLHLPLHRGRVVGVVYRSSSDQPAHIELVLE